MLTLLVSVDEAEGLVRPVVEVVGPPLEDPRVRIALLDDGGGVHEVGSAAVRNDCFDKAAWARVWSYPEREPEQARLEVALPAFAPPGDARPEEVAEWDWLVALCDGKRERAFWSLRPAAPDLNPEAELARVPEA
jgi:hypothetical protein